MARVHIGQLLRLQGLIDEQQVLDALTQQRARGGRFGQALLRLRFVNEKQLLDALGRQLRVPVVHIGRQVIPPEVLRLVPEKVVRRHCALPLAIIGVGRSRRLVVASAAPDDLGMLDEIAFAAGMHVQPVLASDEDVDQAIARHFSIRRLTEPLELESSPPEPMRLVDGRRIH